MCFMAAREEQIENIKEIGTIIFYICTVRKKKKILVFVQNCCSSVYGTIYFNLKEISPEVFCGLLRVTVAS